MMYATGAKNGNYRHGLSKNPIYKLWKDVKHRCGNAYKKSDDYGGRGIYLCPLWLNNPAAFIEWASTHGYEKGLQIDRIDNNGPYSPDNCRFVTGKVNSNNRRNSWLIFDEGEWLTASSYAEKHHVHPAHARKRIYTGKVIAKRRYEAQ